MDNRKKSRIYQEISKTKCQHSIYIKTVLELANPDTKIRMLCLDGGGVKGIIETMTLEYIHFCLQTLLNGNSVNETFNLLNDFIQGNKSIVSAYKPYGLPKMHNMFDAIVGTSIGAIITVGIARLHMSPKELRNELRQFATDIFPPTKYCWSIPTHIIRTLYAGFKANKNRYSEKPLENYLQKMLHDCRWEGGAGDPRFALVTTKAEDSTVHLFSSQAYKHSDKVKLWQAVRASTAAPVYFPSMVIDDDITSEESEFIDGGLGANCPVSYAMNVLNHKESLAVMISLGCGESNPSSVPIARAFQHARNSDEEWEKFCASRQATTDRNLHRLAPSLTSGLGRFRMADSSKVEEMQDVYQQWLCSSDSNWYRIDIVKASASLFAKSISVLEAVADQTQEGYHLKLKLKVNLDNSLHLGQCVIKSAGHFTEYEYDFVIKLKVAADEPLVIDGKYEKMNGTENIELQFMNYHIVGSPIKIVTTYYQKPQK